MKSKLIYIIGFVLVLVLSGIGGYLIGNSKDTKTETIYDTQTLYDTLFITKLETKIKARLDTIYILDTLEIEKPIPIAVADTQLVYIQDIDTAKLKIQYYFPPLNEFYINLRLSQRFKHKADSIYLPKNRTILNRFSIGIGTGLNYNYLANKFDGGINLSIYYSLWDL